jgi:heme exporter protein D
LSAGLVVLAVQLAVPLAKAKEALQNEVDAWRRRETEQDLARSSRFE